MKIPYYVNSNSIIIINNMLQIFNVCSLITNMNQTQLKCGSLALRKEPNLYMDGIHF